MIEVEKRDRRADREKIAAGVESAVSSRSRRAGFWRTGGYLSFVAIALWFGVWFAITEDGFALMRPIMFPSPAKVIEAVVRISHLLLEDVLMTMMRVLVGFTLGALLGIGLGLQMAYNRKVFHFFNPLVESIRPVPVIAMIPFFLMWFGINEPGKLVLITLGVFAIVVVSTLEAVRNVPPIFLRAGETLGASKYQLFRTIIIPAVIPELIGPLRVAAALSYTLVVAGEFMGAQSGLGFRIMEARRLFNPDVILVGVVVITGLSAVTDTLLRKVTGYITRWSERSSSA